MPSTIVCDLPAHGSNPRNSEGAFITLKSGRILFIFTRYRGKSWHDDATADLASRYSDDGGLTWSTRDRIEVKNEGKLNVMSVSLLRLHDGRIALFYLRKQTINDCRPWLRFSRDEGQTWSKPTLCIPQEGYFVVNNDRVIQLKSGRLVIPASFHRMHANDKGQVVHDSRSIAMCFLSDDVGKTWRESRDWRALPVEGWSGLQEPGVIELKRGRVWMYCRTTTGRHWQMFSRDAAVAWTQPEPSIFRAPNSPLCIKRIPSTGDLLAVWNDHAPRWKIKRKPASWGRTPLVAALSSNEGKTWKKIKAIENKPDHGYCYTAIHFVDDAALLAYCCGGGRKGVLQDLRIRRVTLDWLYA